MATYTTLNTFARWFNTSKSYPIEEVAFDTAEMVAAIQPILQDLFNQRTHIGVSALSKPLVMLACLKLHLGLEKELAKIKPAVYGSFLFGHIFESYLIGLLKKKEHDIQGIQEEVDFYGIKGHIDFKLGDAVVDVKTMSDSYFSKFIKQPDNTRGYLTQLAVYRDCLGVKNAIFMCFNKATNRLKNVQIDDEILKLHLQFAISTVETLEQINTLGDIAEIPLPPLVPEVYRHAITGKKLIPQEMQNFPLLHCFYEIVEQYNGYMKLQRYVKRVYSPAEIHANLKRQLTEEAQEPCLTSTTTSTETMKNATLIANQLSLS